MSGNFELALHLFLQLVVILATCRIAGRLLRRVGQTQAVSEMIAGILLGPSLLGLLAPDVQRFLFPAGASMSLLYALSQLGLVLYMFLVGLQLERGLLSQHSRDAVSISLAGILTPVVMGAVAGAVLADRQDLFTEAVRPWQAALLLAAAMSITAFPVLARILHEAGMARTRIGTLALGAAAFNDAVAWTLLACVIAAVNGSARIALLAIGGGAAYTLVMLFAGRPLFRRFERITERDEGVSLEALSVLLLVLMLCAWITDVVGIHAVFGAFIAGAVMPRGRFAREVTRSLEPVAVSLLLPIFFVYSGLNTRMRLLIEPSLFGIAAALVVVAFLCKAGGCGLASRLTGLPWREAGMLGVLMNARGLMELILVNIALEQGLITPALFTILVLMAILTTLVASPLFHLLQGASEPHPSLEHAESGFEKRC